MNDKTKSNADQSPGGNADLQGNDKAPGEEAGKAELVTNSDLKGKKVDADPQDVKDDPVDQSKE